MREKAGPPSVLVTQLASNPGLCWRKQTPIKLPINEKKRLFLFFQSSLRDLYFSSRERVWTGVFVVKIKMKKTDCTEGPFWGKKKQSSRDAEWKTKAQSNPLTPCERRRLRSSNTKRMTDRFSGLANNKHAFSHYRPPGRWGKAYKSGCKTARKAKQAGRPLMGETCWEAFIFPWHDVNFNIIALWSKRDWIMWQPWLFIANRRGELTSANHFVFFFLLPWWHERGSKRQTVQCALRMLGY